MAKIKGVCEKVAMALNYIAMVFMTFAVAITVVNVLSRSIFNAPIFGVTELVQYSVLAAVSLSAAYGTLTGCHPGVEILVDALKPKAKNAIKIFTNVLTMVFFGYFAVKLWPIMTKMMGSHRVTESLFIPYWIINAFIEICMIFVFIVEIILCVEHIYLLIKGKSDFDAETEAVAEVEAETESKEG